MKDFKAQSHAIIRQPLRCLPRRCEGQGIYEGHLPKGLNFRKIYIGELTFTLEGCIMSYFNNKAVEAAGQLAYKREGEKSIIISAKAWRFRKKSVFLHRTF